MRIRTDIWLVRVSAAILLIMVIWHAAPDLRDAFRYRSLILARIDIGIAVVLVAAAMALNLALQRMSRPATAGQAIARIPRAMAIVVVLVACSTALATGFQIGLFFYTIAGSALFCLGLATAAAAVVRLAGDRPFATVAFLAVLYCAAAGAAFQIGAAPVVIWFLNRR